MILQYLSQGWWNSFQGQSNLMVVQLSSFQLFIFLLFADWFFFFLDWKPFDFLLFMWFSSSILFLAIMNNSQNRNDGCIRDHPKRHNFAKFYLRWVLREIASCIQFSLRLIRRPALHIIETLVLLALLGYPLRNIA